MIKLDQTMWYLRALASGHQRGLISDDEYEREFDALNQTVGVPCAQCGRIPATIQHEGQSLCARCAVPHYTK